MQELTIVLQRTGDPANLNRLRPHLELLANIDPNPGLWVIYVYTCTLMFHLSYAVLGFCPVIFLFPFFSSSVPKYVIVTWNDLHVFSRP